MADYKLSYTASEINEKLGKIGQPVSWNDLTDKPFYTEGNWQELLPTTTLPFTLEDGMSAFFTTPTAEMIEIYQGEWSKAIVIWDGVEYECEPKMFYNALKAIGNVELIEGTGDSGEPFAIALDSDGALVGSSTAIVVSIEDTMNGIASSTHSIGVSLLAETIHPIDTKFIDKLSWNKISNKPFEEFTTGTVIADEDVVIQSSGTSSPIGTITPLTVDTDKISNGVPYTITINDTVYTTQGASQNGIKSLWIEDPETYQEIFIYISAYGGFVSETLTAGETYNIKIAFAEDYVKTINAKYLDIVNYESDKILLAEQQLTFIGDEADGFYIDINGISFIEDKTYKVMWDGTEYTYKAVNNNNVVTIGDANPLLAWNEDTGIRIWAGRDLSSSHTVAISEVGVCEIKEEYLPDSLYTAIDQRIEDYINEALGGEY